MGWLGAFYGSSIGKKTVVAVTGAAMIGFLVAHLLGNLLIFEGRGPTPEETKLNEYGQLLRAEMTILWSLRIGLLAAFILHVITIIRLGIENRRARPTGYAVRRYQKANAFSRSMLWAGITLFLYVVYHLLHLTVGVVHTDFLTSHDVYDSVVRSFQNPLIVAIYVLANLALYFHLYHGTVSAFQTLGVSHPRHLEVVRRAGHVLAAVLVLGFISIPLSVFFGIVS